MTILADTHVHIYQCYKLDEFFRSVHQTFETQRRQLKLDRARFVLFLTERSDCKYFEAIAEGKLDVPGYGVDRTSSGVLKITEAATSTRIEVVAGKQIISVERIEILALGLNHDISDGESAASVIKLIKDKGAIPVLPWSPGKWMFERGKVVEGLLENSNPKDFFLGDISLRAKMLSKPKLFDFANSRGFRVLAGSDPLPFAGDETSVGSYNTVLVDGPEQVSPVESLHRVLISDSRPEFCGERNSLIQAAQRYLRLRGVV